MSFPDSSLPEKNHKICSMYQAFNNLAPASVSSIISERTLCAHWTIPLLLPGLHLSTSQILYYFFIMFLLIVCLPLQDVSSKTAGSFVCLFSSTCSVPRTALGSNTCSVNNCWMNTLLIRAQPLHLPFSIWLTPFSQPLDLSLNITPLRKPPRLGIRILPVYSVEHPPLLLWKQNTVIVWPGTSCIFVVNISIIIYNDR